MQAQKKRKGVKLGKVAPKTGKSSSHKSKKSMKIEKNIPDLGAFPVQLGAIRIEIQINEFSVKLLE